MLVPKRRTPANDLKNETQIAFEDSPCAAVGRCYWSFFPWLSPVRSAPRTSMSCSKKTRRRRRRRSRPAWCRSSHKAAPTWSLLGPRGRRSARRWARPRAWWSPATATSSPARSTSSTIRPISSSPCRGMPSRMSPRRSPTTSRVMLTLLKIEAKNLTVPVAVPKKDIKEGQWSIALGRHAGHQAREPAVDQPGRHQRPGPHLGQGGADRLQGVAGQLRRPDHRY